MDEEMQEMVMYYGNGDNNSAYMFVEQMRSITLKKMEDTEIEDEDSDIEIEDLDVTLNEEDREHAGEQEEEENQHSLKNARGDLEKADGAATQEEDVGKTRKS